MGRTSRDQYLEFYDEVLKEARAITVAKGSDYSDNERDAGADTFVNFRTSVAVGVPPETGILVRMLDKITRMGTASAKMHRGDIMRVDENIKETAKDLINYTVIFLAMLEEHNHG